MLQRQHHPPDADMGAFQLKSSEAVIPSMYASAAW